MPTIIITPSFAHVGTYVSVNFFGCSIIHKIHACKTQNVEFKNDMTREHVETMCVRRLCTSFPNIQTPTARALISRLGVIYVLHL